jgi:hypothetical protein
MKRKRLLYLARLIDVSKENNTGEEEGRRPVRELSLEVPQTRRFDIICGRFVFTFFGCFPADSPRYHYIGVSLLMKPKTV